MAATPPEGPAGARGEAVSKRPEDHDDLPDRYRLAGWWTGERLVDRYQRWALADPGRLAVADNSGCLTFGELWGQASALAEDLTYLRPTPGIVLIHLPDTTDWMRTFTAVLMAGGVPATIPITTTADHLRHAIDLVGASTVITCAVHRSTRPAELAAEAARDRAEVITVAAGGVVDRNGVGRLTTTSDASTDRGIPGYRARIRPIVSRITIHWPSFYNVVTGKTLALPNLIALQHIPLSPAGVIAKRPAPIALPNSCAAEWRMAPDAVFSPYASVRYFTPHMVHSQYNLL